MLTKNKIRNLTILGLCVALNIVLGLYSIPILGPSLRITFSFMISMWVASKFSLRDCIIYAIVADIVGFFLVNASEVFFLGYTLSAVLGLVIYWFFLHHEVSWVSVIFAKLSVNLFVNVLVGSIWRTILYSKGFFYYVGASALKNLILCPVEIIIFMAVYTALKRFDKWC